MGVNGLWKLLEPTARPMKLEALAGRKMAIDASIWLHQFMRAMRDRNGNVINGAHLLGFLRRICKLLVFGIKPIFVYDGPAPALKRRVMRNRKKQRVDAQTQLKRTAERLLHSQLKLAATRAVAQSDYVINSLTQSDNVSNRQEKQAKYFEETEALARDRKRKQTDEFEVAQDELFVTEQELIAFLAENSGELAGLDVSSAKFQSLPVEIQHELILEQKLKSRQTSHARLNQMISGAQTALDFSKMQIRNLVHRNDMTHKVSEFTQNAGVVFNPSSKKSRTLASGHVQVKRIASSKNRQYVLVKDDVESAGWKMQLSVEPRSLHQNELEETVEAERGVDLIEPKQSESVTQTMPQSDDIIIISSESEDDGEVFVKVESPRKKPLFPKLSAVPQSDILSNFKERIPRTLVQAIPDILSILERMTQLGSVQREIEALLEADLDPESINFILEFSAALQEKSGEMKLFDDALFEESDLIGWEGNEAEDVEVNEVGEFGLNEADESSPIQHLVSSPAFPEGIDEVVWDRGLDVTRPSDPIVTQVADPRATQAQDIYSESIVYHTRTEESDEPKVVVAETLAQSQMEGNEVEFESIQEQNAKFSLQKPDLPDEAIAEEVVPILKRDDKDAPLAQDDIINLVEDEPEQLEPETEQLEPETEQPGSQSNSREEDMDEMDQSNSDNEVLQEEETEFTRFLSTITSKDVAQIQADLRDEIDQLQAQKTKDTRATGDLNAEMIRETQALLDLFGIPYIVAEAEAEAQCVTLQNQGFVTEIVTDDSDAFLFGGTKIIRNMFSQSKYAELYTLEDIERHLTLTQNDLIDLAYLLGSDYTEGIRGIGPVLGIEILSEFKGPDRLERLRDWCNQSIQARINQSQADLDSDFKKRLFNASTKLDFPARFPDPLVRDGYLRSATKSVTQEFKWKPVDLDGLRVYLNDKVNWSQAKTDENLLPVLKEMKRKAGVQTTLDAFVTVDRNVKHSSKRIQKALSGASGSRESPKKRAKRGKSKGKQKDD